ARHVAHEEWLASEPKLPQAVLEVSEVSSRERLQRRIDRRCHAATKLSRDAVHAVPERIVDVWEDLLDQVAGAVLVRRIDCRPEQGHRDGVDAELRESVEHSSNLRLVERNSDAAVGEDALGQLKAEVTGDVRLGVGDGPVEHLVFAALPYEESVTVAP